MSHPLHTVVSRVDRRIYLGLFVALLGCAATPTKARKADDTAHLKLELEKRETVLGAMKTELERSMSLLKLDDYEAPYFLGYQIKDEHVVTIAGKYGALTGVDETRQRYVYVETRVGDYAFDNYANVDSESYRQSDFRADRRAPVEADVAALRGTLWLLTDEGYKKALSDYLTKRGGAVYTTRDKAEVPSFSKEEALVQRAPAQPLSLDKERWERLVREATASMRTAPFLLDSSMEVSARRVVRYLVTSEGADIIDEHTIYSINAQAYTRAEDGMLLENGRMFYARDLARLPDDAAIKASITEMVAELLLLRDAPAINPYTGPAILDAEAAGVLFHEAVGHRLEGERQRDEQEGRTFKGRVGQVVIPTFLSVYDDPTQAEHEGVQLNGYYAHDDEGVVAQPVTLIEHGILRGFLMSRTPIEGVLRSNGHGRAQGIYKPRARMANLIVKADPEHAVSRERLQEMLIEEVKRQNKPYGLIIRDITGGSTNTQGYGYQAFKGIPRLIYRVDPESGAQTLVRGVELVGTPLSSINKIVAASNKAGIFNGYCGAESGYVPVSTVAPALLTTEIELQRTQQGREKGPILPPPWNE
ncbi:MAG: TldD/PmbA family protein [Bradymonadaceae bacterium]|nr:TldD/PmbA family protein [Lujinxingiaceae bacterium]